MRSPAASRAGTALDVIDAELRRARRSQTPVSLIMFDLDHFKDVNDRHGHLCGDAVLGAVGKRMKEVLRGSDLKCRYGGEEFLVLLPETPLHGARRVAETLRREIAERPVPWSGEALTVTASFGLAQTLPGEVNVQAVIARADQALYRAKDDGRNCVRIAAETATLVADESDRQNRRRERSKIVARSATSASAPRFRNANPQQRRDQERDRRDREGEPEAARLREGADHERRDGAQQAAAVVGHAERGGADGGREDLRCDRAEAAEVSGSKERHERTEDEQQRRLPRRAIGPRPARPP